MPAKKNDPKAPKAPVQTSETSVTKAPAKSRAKTKSDLAIPTTIAASASDTTAEISSKKTARPRRSAAPAVVDDTASVPSAAPKRVRSVRRPATVAAAAEAPSSPSAPASDVATPTERPADAAGSRESEVRLRAYLIYAERGFRGGSPESDWLQAEREVGYGRRA